MKCFQCGKEFDYEKYYGICPKCGCYNKQETPQEQHQEMHNQYDNGYTHGYYGQGAPYPQGPDTRPVIAVREVQSWQNQKGGTAFLIISMVIFFFVFIGGTFFTLSYGERQKERLRQEQLDFEPELVEHPAGERFSFQDLELTVSQAQSLAGEEDLNLPPGKKLVAVQILGNGDGEWKQENQLPKLYIRTEEDMCYLQIPFEEYEIYGNVFQKEGIGSHSLCMSEQLDGWAAFLVEEEQQSVTLCLEEREGESRQQIVRIHQVSLDISEEDL